MTGLLCIYLSLYKVPIYVMCLPVFSSNSQLGTSNKERPEMLSTITWTGHPKPPQPWQMIDYLTLKEIATWLESPVITKLLVHKYYDFIIFYFFKEIYNNYKNININMLEISEKNLSMILKLPLTCLY